MTLVVWELISNLYQEVLIGSHDIQLDAIRPHLLRYASPTGSLRVAVYDVNGKFIQASETIAISAIGSDIYWHGYVRFLISTQLKKATKYRIQLESSGGYAFAEAAYIGWCNDYDLRKVTASYTPNAGTNGALDMEFWENVDLWRKTG